MNFYLISFTSATGRVSRVDLQNYFDSQSSILHWFGIMPEAILVLTTSEDVDLSMLIAERFGNDITFLITNVEPEKTTGFINKEVWDFINNPERYGGGFLGMSERPGGRG